MNDIFTGGGLSRVKFRIAVVVGEFWKYTDEVSDSLYI